MRRVRRREVSCKAQLEQARERIKQVEASMEKAKTGLELAERRTELAEARTELAETRTALAEARAEQAETVLQRAFPNEASRNGLARQGKALEQLTSRQREILQHIAEGQNTKQIAALLSLSPKTVEYHRAKLMSVIGLYDVAGLVRLAVAAGLVPAEA